MKQSIIVMLMCADHVVLCQMMFPKIAHAGCGYLYCCHQAERCEVRLIDRMLVWVVVSISEYITCRTGISTE